jgi:aryl-alcohol dehydrogenase-like predicted oxidoreductase
VKYRKLGNSTLELSEIAFGTGDNAGGIVYGAPQHQHAMVARALELGINTFDCSPDYGKGLGEANLGRVLKELRADPHVITKVEIMPEEFGRMRDKVRESLRDSLMRLGRDHVDVFMLHNPIRSAREPNIRQWTPLTPADVLDEVLPAMIELRDAGLTRYLGLACEAAETAAVRRVLESREFVMINSWFNLANPSAATAVDGLVERDRYHGLYEAAAAFGLGVAVIRPLAGGALTGPILEQRHAGRHDLSRGYLRDQPQVFEPELERGRRFAFLHRPGEQTISEAAFRFILATPPVTTIVGGFSDIPQMEEAVRAVDRGPVSEADRTAIEAVFASGF